MISQIIEEMKKELRWIPTQEIQCIKWENQGWKAVADGQTITIFYSKKHQIARAMLVAKSKGIAFFEAEEDSSFESVGYMADCSRNAVLKVETVKKLVRILASLGYNELQLYMEDTYEVDGEPMFGYLRGRYTKEEMKEMNAYAQKYEMGLVPCIQTLAHLNQLKRWSQFNELFDCNDILLCGDEKVYALIDRMFSTLSECFTSRKIHLGMDEAHMLGRGTYLTRNGYQDPVKVFISHLTKVSEIAEKYGFKPMLWGDMFYRLLSKGEYYEADKKFDESVIESLPKNVELVYWDYYSTETEHYDKMFTSYGQFDNEIRFASGVWKFSGWVPHNTYALHTIDACMPAVHKHHIKRIMTTGWGDDGAECSTFSCLPTLAYFSLKALGKTQSEIEKEFFALTGYALETFMKVDELHTAFSESPTKQPITFTKNALYNDLFLGYLDKLHKGVHQERFQEIIASLASVQKGEYSYIFETLLGLGKTLDKKYDLGIKIRGAYERGDKKALKQAVKEIDKALVELNQFYVSFRAQWYKENKPQGFEVQDIRFGGLILRLKNCRKTLKDYLAGKVDKIPELEETLLEEAFGSCTISNFNVNGWYVNTTANVIAP